MRFAPRRSLVVLWLALLVPATEGADAVPRPWTSVVVNKQADAVQAGVWGRTYALKAALLPTSIETAGQPLLAGPMELVGKVDDQPLAWQRQGVLVVHHDDVQATLAGWAANDRLIVNTTVRVEYDGMTRIDLVALPQRGAKPKVQQLWLEIPLPAARSTLFHYWPGQWGSATNSGAVPPEGLQLPFKPCVWLGWEAGGLCWFAESDRDWRGAAGGKPIEVVRQGDRTVLRVKLVDASLERLPVTFTFGVQATPVKPWPRDFHEWRIWHAPQLATTLGKSASQVFSHWQTCHRAFPDGKFEPALDRAAGRGVKTVVFHEDWAPIQNYPVTSEPEVLQQMIDACHARQMKVLLYFGYELSSLAPEWADLSDKVLVKDAKGLAHPGWHRLPEQRDFKVCYQSCWRDRLADGIEKLIARSGIDGVYLDGTIQPWPCCNLEHGCGYRAADGSLRPTYPIFAVRQLMQRLYGIIHPRGGLINAHQSTCCLTPTLAFADSYWDGEQFAGGELSGNPLSKLPLATFRAEFMGRNFGVPCEFLAYERPPHWTFDDALAFTLLHDVRVRPHGGGERLDQMSSIWAAMSEFGVDHAEWLPYWSSGELLATSADTIKASAYRRQAGAGTPSRLLAVVANLSKQPAQDATVRLNLDRLGLRGDARARDALSGEKLELKGGALHVPLPGMRMRMVRIE